MILVNESYLLDLVHDAFHWGNFTHFERKPENERFKEYLPNLTGDFNELHLNKKQRIKLENAIQKYLEYMEAMDKLSKGIIEEEEKKDFPFDNKK